MRFGQTVRILAVLWVLTSSGLTAQSSKFGGSIRGYQFFSLEEPLFIDRRDSEIWLLRLTDETTFGKYVSLEVHSLLNLTSPPVTQSSLIAYSGAPKFFPLQWDLVDCENLHAGFGLK